MDRETAEIQPESRPLPAAQKSGLTSRFARSFSSPAVRRKGLLADLGIQRSIQTATVRSNREQTGNLKGHVDHKVAFASDTGNAQLTACFQFRHSGLVSAPPQTHRESTMEVCE